jgi:hypothetical protein
MEIARLPGSRDNRFEKCNAARRAKQNYKESITQALNSAIHRKPTGELDEHASKCDKPPNPAR